MQNETSKRHATRYPGIFYREGKRGRRYMFSYRDSDGRQRWKSVDGDLQNARDEQEETRKRRRRGETVRPFNPRLTFREAAAQFFAMKGASLGERTPQTYREQLERVYPFIGDRPVASIRREDIAELVTQLLAKGYSPQTVKGTLTPVSRIFRYLGVQTNPVAALEKDERPKAEPRKQRILTEEEIGRLIETTTQTYRPLIQTAVFTGM